MKLARRSSTRMDPGMMRRCDDEGEGWPTTSDSWFESGALLSVLGDDTVTSIFVCDQERVSPACARRPFRTELRRGSASRRAPVVARRRRALRRLRDPRRGSLAKGR